MTHWTPFHPLRSPVMVDIIPMIICRDRVGLYLLTRTSLTSSPFLHFVPLGLGMPSALVKTLLVNGKGRSYYHEHRSIYGVIRLTKHLP